MLSSTNSNNVPMIISFDGQIINDFDFKYNRETSSSYSCGVTYENEFWIFGGADESKRQVRTKIMEENKTEIKFSRIEGCELKSVGELSFDFYHGACNSFSFGVLLCFDYYNTQSCHM